MKTIENIESRSKEEELDLIREIKYKLLKDDSKIEGIFNSHLINFDFTKKYSSYELPLKQIKKVLIDLSILLGYDLEKAYDLISLKYSNINNITYPIFKENLLIFLDKLENKLNNLFLSEQNSYPIEKIQATTNNDMINDKEKIKDNIYLTQDINLVILHRSLFILKKKFDQFKTQIKKIYSSYSNNDISIDDFIVDCNDIKKIFQDITNLCLFELNYYNNEEEFKNLLESEINYFQKVNIKENVMNEFLKYLSKNRRKYNFIFKEKRNNNNFNLSDYDNYVPEGDDELSKKIVQNLNDDNNLNSNNNNNNIIYEGFNTDIKSEINDYRKNINLEKLLKDLEKEEEIPENVSLNNNTTENFKNKNNEENNQNENDNNEKEKENSNEKEKEDSNEKENKKDFKRKISIHSEFPPQPIKTITIIKNYIYIETLPLIIADFISTNQNYIILEHSDYLRNDLRTLFDNEIFLRLGDNIQIQFNQYKTTQIKELLLNLTKIEENLKNYENLFHKMKNNNQNVKYIIQIIDRLRESKEWIENKIKIIQNDTNTFNQYEEIINNKINVLNNSISRSDINNTINLNNVNPNNEFINFQEQDNFNNNNNSLNNVSFSKNQEFKQNENLKTINFNQNKNILNDDVNNNIKLIENENNINDENIIKNKIILNKNNPINNEEIITFKNNIITNPNNNNSTNKSNQNNNNSLITNQDLSNISISRINNSYINKFNNNNSQSFISISKVKQRKNMSIQEKREIALKEIFYFYSRQHTFVGHKSTFDSIKDKFDHLNLSEFMKFCNEFKILVNKEKLIEIFKKTANLSKEMNLEEFKIGLQKISFAINDEKIEILKKSVKQLKSELKKIIQELKNDGIEVDNKNLNNNNNENKENEKMNEQNNNNENNENKEDIKNNDENQNNNQNNENENKNENENNENNENENKENENNENENKEKEKKEENNKKISSQSQLNLIKKDQLSIDISKCQNDIESLKSKQYSELIEELYLYLEIDDENEYRKKMKGFILPFNYIKNNEPKVLKLPPIITSGKSKKINKQSIKEIKDLMNQRKFEEQNRIKKIIRFNDLDREYQKKNIDLINNKILKNSRKQNNFLSLNSNNKGIFIMKKNKKIKKVSFDNSFTDKNTNYYQKSMFSKKYYNNNNYFDKNDYRFNNLSQNYNNYNNQSRFNMVKDKNETKIVNYEEPKIENKFSWDTIEKSSSVRFMNQDEIMKLINDN